MRLKRALNHVITTVKIKKRHCEVRSNPQWAE